MASKSYPLVEGGPKRLELRWKGKYKDLVVIFDGQQINPEPFSKAEMAQGQVIELPDASHLIVGRNGNQLEVTRNGTPLPGSSTHVKTQAKGAATILWVIAGLTLILDVLVYAETGAVPWVGMASVVVFAVLGLLVRNGSLAALWVGIVLYSIDTLLTLFTSFSAGEFPVVVMIVKVALIVGLARALPAVRSLQATQTS